MGIFTQYPGKALWVGFVVLLKLVQLPIDAAILLFSRPSPKWTVRQSLMVRSMRSFLYHTAVVEAKTPLRLEPGPEQGRFVQIPVARQDHYKFLLDDQEIRPMEIGGTWYPNPPSQDHKDDFILHFHGGGYAIGEGRPGDAAYATKTLSNIAKYTFMPSYRLASNPGGRFPAALQDAVSAYAFLISTGIEPRRILLSGDSAGGHIALSLLRYICTQRTPLEPPRATLLWSPAIDLIKARDPQSVNQSKYYATDYLHGKFTSWGALALTRGLQLSDESIKEYLVQLDRPFTAKTPIWICIGEREILSEDAIAFGYQLQSLRENVVGIEVVPEAPHDVMFVGNILGFEREAENAAKAAKAFIKAH
ncbi:MAG: hypothetical protein M1821_002662 [Bathelium mastoideum]|nr:MAG: hypothetical protein M1821_002662 [Bathelium mastoideum]